MTLLVVTKSLCWFSSNQEQYTHEACLGLYGHTHTHAHTHIYIYIDPSKPHVYIPLSWTQPTK